ncbi:unnamed protein product [Eruca vesicaria subsp. sativa]|uniref:Beta-adaptin-like protein n=1 Tax=Eruca vesicaria subsp. sativa TaxID=29727 RepID=A0ABC8ILZ6_ERUVS|nr:unnamed protein product [Eruca vesicaria subsp. sativa]
MSLKSEVTDLKSQLRQLAGSRAPGVDDSKRDLFKKVISYMTIGIDVSSVFGEMGMCSATSDIVLKKMCYLYVGNYAKGSGLKDNSSYVRTIAVTGVLKLYHISASTCIDADFPAMLKSLMLHDSDAQVVVNCLSALQEIWSLEASHSEEACREKESLLSKPVIYYFLNRIKEFSEWAQCLILELAVKYVPSDGNDIFDIMNLLEDRLQHANGAVVLATVKVFLQLTLSMTDVHQQVYERIKSPLLTLVSSGSPEQSYAILSHLHLLVVRAPFIFASDYKHFYCQYNEPSYVKKLKLEMLTAVANESNTYEIVTELCEYAANVDIAIARESIRAIGKIALQQYDVNAIVDRLLQFLEMEKDYVTAETLDMSDAPYVLENLIENWEEEHSAEVRLHLLTAAMKCFFKRPPETQKALGIALAAGIADFHQNVLLVLQNRRFQSLMTLKAVIKDRIFDEFNSLSVLYQKPSYMFTDKEHRGPFEFSDEIGNMPITPEASSDIVPAQQFEANDKDLLLSTDEKDDNKGVSNNGSAYTAPAYDNSNISSQMQELAISGPATSATTPQSSFDLDDLFGLGLSAAPTPTPSPPLLKLNPRAALDPGAFQQK